MNKKEKPRRDGAHSPSRPRGLHGRLVRLTSSFRLSLTFRIALHFCWQLFCTLGMALLLLSVVCFGTILADIEGDMQRLREAEAGEDGAFSQEAIQDASIAAWLEETPFSDKTTPLMDYRLTGLELRGNAPFLTVAARHVTGQTIRMEISLRREATAWAWLMGTAAVIDLLRMAIFLRRREGLNRSVLAPIRDITDMAATLSASNLSNRINIAGTKNELKDLAAVINSMLDRIERSYNSQKQFVSDASHELRTPIAVIQGYVRMLQRWGKADADALEEGISAIAQETASMRELVESLLFLARHDKKTLMMELTRFDAAEVASELHREAAMVTPEDSFVLNAPAPCPVEADRNMLKQVLRILCDNAVKYTPSGGTVTIGAVKQGEMCVLSVTDTGPGISADELPKIFERFYRSDSARKGESGGHGLGLSIARIIVKAHGGKLRVRSRVGGGSTFYVELPCRQEQLHTAQFKEAAPEGEEAPKETPDSAETA